MYIVAITIFVALLTSTIGFAYQGNLALTLGFGLATIALIIAVVGFTFMYMLHSFIMALSNPTIIKCEKDSTTDEQ